jgi:hypothetical protein
MRPGQYNRIETQINAALVNPDKAEPRSLAPLNVYGRREERP